MRTLTSSAEVGSSAIKSFSLASSIIADQRNERELTYVLVSHDLAVIAHMCDRVLIMKDGRFIDELSKSDLKTGTTHEAYSREFFEASFM